MPDLFYIDGQPKAREGRLVKGIANHIIDGGTLHVTFNENSMLGPDIKRNGLENTVPLKLTGVDAPSLGDKINESIYENDEVDLFESERGRYINSEPNAHRAASLLVDLVEGKNVLIDLRTENGSSTGRAITGRKGLPEGIVYYKDGNKWVNLNRTIITNGYADLASLDHSNLEQPKKNEYLLDSTLGIFKDNREEIENNLKEERDDFLGGFDVDKNARIGDTILPIPPENISMISKNQQDPISVMRNSNQMMPSSGSNAKQIQLDFYFDQKQQINGYRKESDWQVKKNNNGEEKKIHPTYYINGLRSLIAQFKLTPFLPVENTTLNFEFDVEAITLQNLVVTNLEEFPNVIQVSVIAKEFNYKPYMDSERPFSYFFDWKLFRFYYQRMLKGTDLDFDGDKLPLYESNNDNLSIDIMDMSSLQELEEAVHTMRKSPNDTAMNYAEGDTAYERLVHDYLLIRTAKQQRTKANELMDKYNITRDNFNDKGKRSDVKSFIQEYVQYCADEKNNPIYKDFDGYDYAFEPLVGFMENFLGEADSYKTRFVFYRPFTGINTFRSPFSEFKYDPHFMIRLRSPNSVNTINVLVENTTNYYNPTPSGDYYSLQDRYIEDLPPTLKNYSTRMKQPITSSVFTSFKDSYGEFNSNKTRTAFIPNYFFELVEDQIALKGKTKKQQRDKAIKLSKDEEMDYNWQTLDLSESFLQDVTVSLQNRVTKQDISMETKATHQYLGAKMANINIQLVTQNPFDVNKLTSLVDYAKVLQKKFNTVIDRPILKLDNNIVNLFGFYGVQINELEVQTVKDLPNTYDVKISFLGVFKPPENFQSISKIYSEQLDDPDAGLIEDTESGRWFSFPNVDVSGRTQDIDDYLKLKEQLKYINLYPDLYLPKYSELPVESDLYEENSDVFVDPDFYTLSKSNLFVKKTLNVLEGFESEVNTQDSSGNYIKALVDELGNVDLSNMENLTGNDEELEIDGLDNDKNTKEKETYKNNNSVKKLYRIMSNKINSNEFEVRDNTDYSIRDTINVFQRHNHTYYNGYDISNTIVDNRGQDTVAVFIAANWSQNQEVNDIEGPRVLFDKDGNPLPSSDLNNAEFLGLPLTRKDVVTDDMSEFLRNRGISGNTSNKIYDYMAKDPRFNGLVLASAAQKYYSYYSEYLSNLSTSDIAKEVTAETEMDTMFTSGWSGTNAEYTTPKVVKEMIMSSVHENNLDTIFKIISLLNAKGYSIQEIADGNETTTTILNNMSTLYKDLVNSNSGTILPMDNYTDADEDSLRFLVQKTAQAIMNKDDKEVYNMVKTNSEKDTKTQGSTKERIINAYKDMLEYDQRGRLLRAFPSYYLMLIDEGHEMFIWSLQDVFYHYDGVKSIDVVKDKENIADAAYIELFNTKMNLSDPTGGFAQKNSDLELVDIIKDIIPFESYEISRNKREQEPVSVQLNTGARIHLRMGYGSTPAQLPIVFNGTITEIQLGQVVKFVAQGDGVELSDPLLAGPKEISEGGLYEGNLLTKRANPQEILLSPLTDLDGLWSNMWRGIGRSIAEVGFDSNVAPFNEESEYGPSYIGANYKPDFWEGPISMRQPMKDEQFMDFIRPSAVTYERAQNIYSPNSKNGGNEEIKFSMFLYGKTVYDVLQTCAMTVPNWIGDVHPFGIRRSTIFYGHPSFELAYDYKRLREDDTRNSIYDNMKLKELESGKSVIEEVKTYRQYKVYGSYSDIIANNIRLSQENIVTAVKPIMYTRDKEEIKELEPVFLDTDIHTQYQTQITVDTAIITPNLGTRVLDWTTSDQNKQKRAAKNYSISTMQQHVDSMYSGELLIIGDPTVKPYDQAHIYDLERKMSGPIEVNRVTLSMDSEIGFVTSINPNPVSTANRGFKKDISNYLASNRAFRSIFVPHFYSRMMTSIASSIVSNMGSTALSNALTTYSRVGVSAGAMQIGKVLYGRASSVVGSLALQVNTYMKDISHVLQHMDEYFKNMVTNQYSQFAGETIDLIRKYLKDVYKGASPSALKNYASYIAGQAKYRGSVYGSTKLASIINSTLNMGSMLSGMPVTLVTMGVDFVVTRSIIRWLRNERADNETITIMPLSVNGEEFTAGINGHQGAVLSDSPGYFDRMFNHPIVNFFIGESDQHKIKNLMEDDLDSTTDLMKDIQQNTALGQDADYQKYYQRIFGENATGNSSEEIKDIKMDNEMTEIYEDTKRDFILPINSDIKYYYNSKNSNRKDSIVFET